MSHKYKSFSLVLILLTLFAVGVMSIWRCRSDDVTEPPIVKAFLRLESCYDNGKYELLPYSINANNSYTLDSAQYGVKGLEINETIRDASLINQLYKNFFWIEEALSYLGPLVNETILINFDPNSGHSVFYQGVATCKFNLVGNETTSKDMTIYTGPLLYTFPSVVNCTPEDYYETQYNIESQGWDPWFVNNSSFTLNLTNQITGGQFYFGIPEGIHPCVGSEVFQNGRRKYQPPATIMLKNKVANKFVQMNQSKITGIKWKKDFITTLPIFGRDLITINATIPPNIAARFYVLSGSCGNDLPFRTTQIYQRNYDKVNGNCADYPEARGGIEKCDFCLDLQCASEGKLKNLGLA